MRRSNPRYASLGGCCLIASSEAFKSAQVSATNYRSQVHALEQKVETLETEIKRMMSSSNTDRTQRFAQSRINSLECVDIV